MTEGTLWVWPNFKGVN